MMMLRAVTMSLMLGLAVTTMSPLSQLTVRIDDQIPVSACHSTLAHLDTLISRTSSELATLSKHQLDVRRVTVMLPRSWHSDTCVRGLPLSSLASITEADILVKDIQDPEIRPLQFGGCGVRGRRVILPRSRLIPENNETQVTSSASTDLLHSLLKHEFGYFDTHHGRVGDPAQFPELHKVGELETEPENCNRDPFSDADYKTEAPTKQNLMCQEQSPMSVIASSLRQKGSSDEERKMTPAQGPRYEYLIRHSERTLLVLDRSQESKHVWKHLHNALYR